MMLMMMIMIMMTTTMITNIMMISLMLNDDDILNNLRCGDHQSFNDHLELQGWREGVEEETGPNEENTSGL